MYPKVRWRTLAKKTAIAVAISVIAAGSVTALQQPAAASTGPQAQTSTAFRESAENVRVISMAELQQIRANASAAADGCGSSCDNKDPQTYKIYHSGCSTCYHYCADDAYTVYDAPDVPSGPFVELRYSPRCQTAWARGIGAWTPTINSYYMSGSKRTSAGLVSDSASWTKMLNDHNLLAEACAKNGPSSTCTARY